jgi:WD40 repeat protein
VAYSPNGKRIVSGSQSTGTLEVWDAQTGERALSPKGSKAAPVTSVAYSPDSKRIASGGQEGALKVWDAQTGQEVLSLKGHTWIVTSVAFSPDSKRIVSASSDLKVWERRPAQRSSPSKGTKAMSGVWLTARMASGSLVGAMTRR